MSGPLVLCYHAVGVDWSLSVTADQLRGQVSMLLRRGYEPATFGEAVGAANGRKRFVVTFDDAHASVLQHALPVLDELGVAATLFAVTTFAEEGRPLEWPGLAESGLAADAASRASLSWAELRELAEAGWEIGSHTCTHPHLPELDDEVLARELRDSRDACREALGRPCTSIAYPYGDLDGRVVEAAAAAGYTAGCSLSVSTSGALARPRVGVYAIDSPTRFKLKVSPVVLWARRALA